MLPQIRDSTRSHLAIITQAHRHRTPNTQARSMIIILPAIPIIRANILIPSSIQTPATAGNIPIRSPMQTKITGANTLLRSGIDTTKNKRDNEQRGPWKRAFFVWETESRIMN